MTIYNLGSINIDHIYQMEELPKPGETLSALSLSTLLGGKGMNISVALKRAGADVRHIGAVGAEDAKVRGFMQAFGLDLTHIRGVAQPTGHAMICVDQHAENHIVLFAGANAAFTEDSITAALSEAQSGDWLVMQNETNANEMGLKLAREKGMKIALVAAPFDARMPALMDQVDLVSVNKSEVEAYEAAIGGSFRDRKDISFLVTYGADGAEFVSGGQSTRVHAHKVDAVDTTGAGDTFSGGFLAHYAQGASVEESLKFASAMSAVQVQQQGAAVAIPTKADVLAFLESVAAE